MTSHAHSHRCAVSRCPETIRCTLPPLDNREHDGSGGLICPLDVADTPVYCEDHAPRRRFPVATPTRTGAPAGGLLPSTLSGRATHSTSLTTRR